MDDTIKVTHLQDQDIDITITQEELDRLRMKMEAQNERKLKKSEKDDPINHPRHYNTYKGLEVIDLVEQMNFNKGNAVKYIARAGHKNPDTEIEDLKKARWYIDREIMRLEDPRHGS